MQTYSDYSSDTGLGFGFSQPSDEWPTLRRASDVGGSEIYFVADDARLAHIEADCASDEQCGPDNDGPEGSDSGLVEFWKHVESVINAYAKAYDSEDAALAEIIAEIDLAGEIHWEGEGDGRNAYLYVEVEGKGPTELIWDETTGWDYHSLCAHGRPDNDALMERVRDWANAEFAAPLEEEEKADCGE